MKFKSVMRTVLALLLCLLLPLQAGATLARATAMARHGSAGAAVAVKTEQAGERVQPLAHAGHQRHGAQGSHAGAQDAAAAHHGAHRAANHPEAAAHGQQAQGKAASHQSVHAKAGCVDCAKCCLLAASAPPPVLTADFAPAVARASFLSQSAPAPSFLTDGPDRPPRHLIA